MKRSSKKITLTGYVFDCPSHQMIFNINKIFQEFSNKHPSENSPMCLEFHLLNWKILYVPFKNGYVLFDGFNVGHYDDHLSYRANEYYLNIQDDKIFSELKDGEKVRVSGYISRTSKKTVFVKNVTRLNEENLISIVQYTVNNIQKFCSTCPQAKNPWKVKQKGKDWLKIFVSDYRFYIPRRK